MADPLRVTFARLCRETRSILDITQRELAGAVGVSRPFISAIEAGRADPSLDLVQRIAAALGLEIDIASRPPVVAFPKPADQVHAWCSGHIDRRLRAAGWETRREQEIVLARAHGWIDLLAFDPRTRTLVIVEIKTRIDDLGAIERQLGWYERDAALIAQRHGWRPRRIATWLLVLASEEAEAVLRDQREVLRLAFPARASDMRQVLAGVDGPRIGRGLALIDPASRRADWVIPTRLEGRRSVAPYRDYADAARRLERPDRSPARA
ncbi:MAG: helix-turn-helix domain-containing protein [Candidatus Limnocylindrales bacterium]